MSTEGGAIIGRGRSRLSTEQGAQLRALSEHPEIMTGAEGRRLTETPRHPCHHLNINIVCALMDILLHTAPLCLFLMHAHMRRHIFTHHPIQMESNICNTLLIFFASFHGYLSKFSILICIGCLVFSSYELMRYINSTDYILK